jgi:hypothetical protein
MEPLNSYLAETVRVMTCLTNHLRPMWLGICVPQRCAADVQGDRNCSTTTGVTTPRDFSCNDSVIVSASAPLHELGWRQAFTPDLRLAVYVSNIKKNGGSLNGYIYSASAGVEWFLSKNVGVAADYGIQKNQLGRDDDRAPVLNRAWRVRRIHQGALRNRHQS